MEIRVLGRVPVVHNKANVVFHLKANSTISVGHEREIGERDALVVSAAVPHASCHGPYVFESGSVRAPRKLSLLSTCVAILWTHGWTWPAKRRRVRITSNIPRMCCRIRMCVSQQDRCCRRTLLAAPERGVKGKKKAGLNCTKHPEGCAGNRILALFIFPDRSLVLLCRLPVAPVERSRERGIADKAKPVIATNPVQHKLIEIPGGVSKLWHVSTTCGCDCTDDASAAAECKVSRLPHDDGPECNVAFNDGVNNTGVGFAPQSSGRRVSQRLMPC